MQSIPHTSQRNLSHLIIIDMQIKLASAMDADAMQSVSKNCGILLQAAKLLDIPALYTEQYPRGLGATLSELEAFLTDIPKVEKTTFSCSHEPSGVCGRRCHHLAQPCQQSQCHPTPA